MRKIAAAVILSVLAFNAVALEKPAGGEKVLLEDWYVQKLNGKTSGWAHHRSFETTEGGRVVIKSNVEEVMNLNVGGTTLPMTMKAEFVESKEGHLLSLGFLQDDGMVEKVTEGRVEGGKLHLTIDSGGQVYQREINLPDDVIVGYAEEMLTRKKGFVPGTTYSYKTFTPELGVQTFARKVVGKEKIEVNGAPVVLNRIDLSGMAPGVTMSEYRDDEGHTIAGKLPLLGMEFIMELSTAEDVAIVRQGKQEGVDISELTFSKIVNPHPRPRRVESARYLIKPVDGKPFEDLKLDGGGQKSRETAEGIVLEVSFPRKFLNEAAEAKEENVPEVGVAAASFAVPTDCPYKECLSSGPYVQSDLPEIKQRARDIVANAKDYLEAARKCEKWVRQNLNLSMGKMSFAPASVILEKREGDCTEAGVLLASLLRAEEIPCRLVAGVVQVQGLIGFHMWAEVWGGKKGGEDTWIPFDSAVPSEGRVDATHIRLAAISDDANVNQGAMALAQVIGRVSFTGLEYRAEGMVWGEGQPWAVVEKGTVVHKGYLVTFPIPVGMKLGSIAKDGEVKLVDEKEDSHTIRVNDKEIPPEYSFTEAFLDFARHGWRISLKEFRSYHERPGLDVFTSKDKREVKVIYINDGDALIRIIEEPPVRFSESLKEIIKGLRFLTKAGYGESR